MNAAATGRLVLYGTGAASLGAVFLQMYGLATYDPVTGMVDLAPFNVNTIIPAVISGGANLLAMAAVMLGWKARQ